MDERARLDGIDPNPGEMVVGYKIGVVAGRANPKSFTRHNYRDVPVRRVEVASGVWSCFGPGGARHFWLVDGQIVTHPHSVGAMLDVIKARKQAHLAAERWKRHYHPGAGAVLGPAR
jgi:hypothetical protein